MSGRRRAGRWLAIVMVSAVVVTAVAALAGGRDGRRPASGRQTVVTAAVERRPLASSTIVRGSVVTVDPVSVVAPPRAEGQSSSVVTAAPLEAGADVLPGRALVEVNGRPIVGLPLAVPLYRDVVPGASGPDVVAVQAGLAALGFDVPAAEQGTFGPGSQAAVGALFEDLGAEAAYVAGSKAAFEAGRAEADGAIDDALAAANRSRAQGTADPELDAAVATAGAELASFIATQGIELRAAEVARVDSHRSVVVGPVPAVGDAVEAGDALLTIAAPQPEARLQLTDAQAATLTSKTTIDLTGPSYTGTCRSERLITDDATDGEAPPPGDETASDPTAEAGIDESSDGNGDGDGSGQSGARGSQTAVTLALSCTAGPTMDDLGAGYTATLRTTLVGAGLVVPATAVANRTDGRAFVERSAGAGRFERIPVEIRAEDAGFVAIAETSQALEEGDRVRVRRG